MASVQCEILNKHAECTGMVWTAARLWEFQEGKVNSVEFPCDCSCHWAKLSTEEHRAGYPCHCKLCASKDLKMEED